MRRTRTPTIALVAVVLLVAGCLGPDGTAPSQTVHGPTGLGQPLSVDVSGQGQAFRVVLHLPGQEDVTYTLPASNVDPHVAHVYDGSIPAGASFTAESDSQTIEIAPTPEKTFVLLYRDAGRLAFNLNAEQPMYL